MPNTTAVHCRDSILIVFVRWRQPHKNGRPSRCDASRHL